MNKVKVRAYPRIKRGCTSATFEYHPQIDWLDEHTTFVMPVRFDTQEDAVDRAVDMLNFFRDTYGEEYELV